MRLGIRTTLALLALLAAPASARADEVLDWNAIMVATVSTQNPFAQARTAAITHLAVFEAVNAITGTHQPYLGWIGRTPGASTRAAVVAAAHGVLRGYFPGAAASLDAARAASLAMIPDGPDKASGIAVGEAAAAAMVAHRASDGATPPQFHLPSSSNPGEWQTTPACPPAGGVLRHWGNLVPFGIERLQQFRPAPPPPLSSETYARDFDEVKLVGAANSPARPPHKADIALFYNVVLAVGTWNPAVAQAAEARGLLLAENARLFALLNMAISDGLVAVMDTKYTYNFWRPETAIRGADSDGNPATVADPAFEPFVATPCFPGYGSAHAAASYAAREIAEALLGAQAAVSLASGAVPGVVLHYSSFQEITEDIDDARVYGGIHFRFDQRAGAMQGRRIGAWLAAHALRPLGESPRP